MLLSLSAFLTTLFFSSVMIILTSLLFENVRIIKYVGISSVIFCIMIVTIRLFFPIEFNITKSIPSMIWMPQLLSFLNKPLLVVNNHLFKISHILVAFWLIGVIFRSLNLIFTHLKFIQKIDSLPPISDKHTEEILEKVIMNYPYYVAFRILQAPGLLTPLMYGVRTQTIVLPNINFTDDELYHVLLHETAHHYNHDFLFKIAVEFLCILYWWNPLVYLLKKQIETWLEIRADSTVIRRSNDWERIKYLECLLKIAGEFKTIRGSSGISTLYSNTSTLKKRFHAAKLYGNGKMSKGECISTFCVVILALFITGLSFSIVFEPYVINPKETSGTIELKKNTSYLVRNNKGGYDIYFDSKYYATVHKIPDSLSELQIYKSLSEVQK